MANRWKHSFSLDQLSFDGYPKNRCLLIIQFKACNTTTFFEHLEDPRSQFESRGVRARA